LQLKTRILTSFFNNRSHTLKNRQLVSGEKNLKTTLRKLRFCDTEEKRMILLLNALEAKDPYTKGHSESVARYALLIGRNLGLTQEELDNLQVAAYLHDVGKIMIDRKLLTKPGRLNHTEETIIQKHPEIGFHILQGLNLVKEIVLAVLHHHERWDGTGYPHRLFGYEIPLFARILAVADAYDAIISNRPYRSGKPPLSARNELEICAGYQFDPDIVRAFLRGLNALENS
jgi:putative nucleotidyltransferase with HDIG domain